ncbi:MAG: type II secretion system protein GspM [Rhodospirillales bacterium]
MKPLSPPTSRGLALLLLGIVLVLPYALIVQPVIEKRATSRETLADYRDQLERYRRIAANVPSLQAHLEEVRRDPKSSDAYLSGDNESLVAASLQNRIKTIIESSGGSLASTQILPSSIEQGFRVVTVRVRMTADIDAATRTLYALEADPPYLFIDNVDISSRQVRRTPGSGRPATEDVQLNISFDVYGYLRVS